MRILPVYITILVLSFASLTTSAQSIQQQKTDSVFQIIKTEFNNKQADNLYALTGETFKNNVSLDKFRDIANTQLFSIGDILESKLVSFVNNKIATYKLVFSTVTLQMLISLDDDDKLGLFLFQPYKESVFLKPAPVATSNHLITRTDKVIDTLARTYIQKISTAGLSIGIYKNGKFSTYNYGETEKGNRKLPTDNTIYEIGSITKTFTATLLAYYVNEGKVQLTDPITKYLPDSIAANPSLQSVTLLNLSNHTSGLPSIPDNLDPKTVDPANPYKDYTKQMMFAYLESCKLNSKPGTQYVYSNLAVALLGIILENVNGQPYDQMVNEIITKPLAMNSTEAFLTPIQKQRFAAVYNQDGQQTPVWDWGAIAACGILKSSVNDMLLYAKANMANGSSKLSQAFALTHQITFDKNIKLGLNWILITVNGTDYYFHNGGTGGSSSFLAFNAEKNIAVVVLSNCAESTDALGAGLLKKLTAD